MSNIKLIGDISEDLYRDFVEQLDEASKTQKTIEVELLSHGGDAQVALAFYDRIRNNKVPVNITAYGLVASAAVLILAAGAKRRMARNAWVMVHEDTTDVSSKHDKVSEVEKKAMLFRMFEDQWNKLLENVTGTGKDVWEHLHKEETYLNPSQCLAYKLIQEIV